MRRAFSWLLVVVVMMALAAPVLAADPLLPPKTASSSLPSSGNTPLYDRYSPWNYTFEGEGMDVQPRFSAYMALNLLLVTKAWLVKLSIRVTEYALYDRLLDNGLVTKATSAVGAFNGALWNREGGALVAAALTLAGMWALVQYLRGRLSRLGGAVGATFLVLISLTAVVGRGPEMVTGPADLARALAVDTFGAVERVSSTAPSPGLVERSGVAAWKALVYQPWLDGQFGPESQGPAIFRDSAAGIDGGRMLNIDTPSTRRAQADCMAPPRDSIGNPTRPDYCPWWRSTDFMLQRLVLAISTLALSLIYAGTVLTLAGGILLTQLALLLLLALSPAWLMVALWWPERGLRILEKAAARGIKALVTQVMFAATLAVLLLLTEQSYTLFSTSRDWMFVSLLLSGLAAIAFRYRYAWLVPVQSAVQVYQRGDNRWLEQLRTVITRRQPAAAGASGATVTDLVPMFAAVRPPRVNLEVAAPEAPVPMPALDRPEPVLGPRELFLGQMRLLRERINQQEVMVYRGSAAQDPYRDWDEPAPASGPGTVGDATGGGGRPSQAKQPLPEASRIPPQRPRS